MSGTMDIATLDRILRILDSEDGVDPLPPEAPPRKTYTVAPALVEPRTLTIPSGSIDEFIAFFESQ